MHYNRYLEKKLELTLDDGVNTGEKIPIELEYYIIECKNNLNYIVNEGKRSYGIEIVKKIDDSNYESEMLREISCCRENTKKILNKLASNKVTPVEVPFIMDDMLAE